MPPTNRQPSSDSPVGLFASPNADPSSFYVYTVMDNRPRLLVELGMKNSPLVEERSEPGQFLFNISAERTAQLDADVFLTYATSEANVKELADNPLVNQIPAVADNRWYAQVAVAEALLSTLRGLDPRYPELDDTELEKAGIDRSDVDEP